MKRHRICPKSGLTLIEVIISMALLGLVTTMVFSMFGFSRKLLDVSENELKLQSSARLTLANTSNIIRYSTAVFTIPKSSFRANNLDKGWNYIGIHEVELIPAKDGKAAVKGQEIVRYTYNATTLKHDASVLIEADPDVNFKFTFTKVNPTDEDSLLKFSIKSYDRNILDEFGNPAENYVVTSEVESLNSLQVVDLSTAGDPAVAIAYRKEGRGRNVIGHIAMVMDSSGSMSDGLGGSTKNKILEKEAKNMVNKFAQEENLQIALVPFATSANDPYDFLDAKTSTSTLLDNIEDLNAVGGTNTGDGLRRAYWLFKKAVIGSEVTNRNYIIILVDGVTTFASVEVGGDSDDYLLEDGNIDEDRYSSGGQVVGNGTYLDAECENYVRDIGSLLKPIAKAYVIGFSNKESELLSVGTIAAACGADPLNVFRAESSDDLNKVFESIRQDIVNDLWYLRGPEL